MSCADSLLWRGSPPVCVCACEYLLSAFVFVCMVSRFPGNPSVFIQGSQLNCLHISCDQYSHPLVKVSLIHSAGPVLSLC